MSSEFNVRTPHWSVPQALDGAVLSPVVWNTTTTLTAAQFVDLFGKVVVVKQSVTVTFPSVDDVVTYLNSISRVPDVGDVFSIKFFCVAGVTLTISKPASMVDMPTSVLPTKLTEVTSMFSVVAVGGTTNATLSASVVSA